MKRSFVILMALLVLLALLGSSRADVEAYIINIASKAQEDFCPGDGVLSNLCWAACIQSLIALDNVSVSQCAIHIYSNQLEGYFFTGGDDFDCCGDQQCYPPIPNVTIDPMCNRRNGLTGDPGAVDSILINYFDKECEATGVLSCDSIHRYGVVGKPYFILIISSLSSKIFLAMITHISCLHTDGGKTTPVVISDIY